MKHARSNSRRNLKSVIFVLAAFATIPVGAIAAEKVTADELMRLVRTQQKQIEALQTKIEMLARETEKASADAAEAKKSAETRTSDSDKSIESSDSKVKVAISGHVNRALMITDDGGRSDAFHVDNDTEPTLLNVTGTFQPTDDITMGAVVEVSMASNASNAVNQNTQDAAIGGINFNERKLEVFFASDTYGKLYLGQGATSTEDVSEADLSGTRIVTRSNFGTFGGGVLFRNSSTGALTTVAVGNVFDNFDGLGRDERIRYDSPRFSGFQLSGGLLQGGTTDFALNYGGEFSGTKVIARAGLANQSSTSSTVDRQWSGSGSVLLENGLSLTVAAGTRDLKAAASDDPVFYYGKVGYSVSWFEIGNTSFSIDAAREHDLAANGDDGTLLGFGATQRFDEYNTELYAGIRNYDLDRSGTPTDDITIGMIGAFVAF